MLRNFCFFFVLLTVSIFLFIIYLLLLLLFWSLRMGRLIYHYVYWILYRNNWNSVFRKLLLFNDAFVNILAKRVNRCKFLQQLFLKPQFDQSVNSWQDGFDWTTIDIGGMSLKKYIKYEVAIWQSSGFCNVDLCFCYSLVHVQIILQHLSMALFDRWSHNFRKTLVVLACLGRCCFGRGSWQWALCQSFRIVVTGKTKI